MSKMYAGAAKRVISPTEEHLKLFNEQNKFHDDFDGVYEDIYVRVIAVSDGEKKVLLIGADLIVYPGQQKLSERLEKEFGIEPFGCIIGVTHNHESPNGAFKEGDDFCTMMQPATESREKYAEYVHDMTVEAAREALSKLEPAKMGVKSCMSYINCNRDLETPIGPIQANDFHGPSDHELLLVQFENMQGEIIGMFVNHATHSNMACWILYNNEFKKVHGDVGGGISRFVEKANKNKFPVIWVMGAAGDQSPFVRSKLRSIDVDDNGEMKIIESYTKPATVLKQLEMLVCTQGMEILQLSKEMDNYTDEFSFSAAETWKEASARMPYARLKLDLKCDERPQPQPWVYPTFKHHMRLAVLNGVSFASMNGEIYSLLGTYIKEMLPTKYTAIVSMSYGMLSYIPDATRERINGFGTMSTIAASAEETERCYNEAYAELMEKVGLKK